MYTEVNLTRHALSPGYAVLIYTSNTHEHRMTIPVNPDVFNHVPGDAVSLYSKGAGLKTLAVAAGEIVNAIKALFTTTATFNELQYWQKPTPTSDPVFIRSDTIVAGAGTEAVASIKANSQLVLSGRTTLGGLMRCFFMEGWQTVDYEFDPPTYGGFTALTTFVTYMTGINAVWCGRDGGYMQTSLRAFTKTNDALRKKFILS